VKGPARRVQRKYDRPRTLAAVLEKPPATLMKRPLIDWREVARLISMGRRWIYARAKEGAWGARLVGNTWRFRRDLVEAWIAGTSPPGIDKVA